MQGSGQRSHALLEPVSRFANKHIMFTTAATCKQFELDLLNPGCAADSLEMRRTLVLILQNNIKVPPFYFLS